MMTDEQIIKAYERCFTLGFDESTCYECPFYTATAKCTEDLRDSVLNLINRQRAEIEELKTDIERLENQNTLLLKKKCKDINTARKIIKSEAIKEFAEKLKKRFYLSAGRCVVDVYHIDNLVKEMTEEQE